MTDRDVTPEPLDDSQEYDDPSPIDDGEPPRHHQPTPEELAVEAAARTRATGGDIASDVALTDREAAANDVADAVRRGERRNLARWSGRAASGLAVVALGVGAVLGASALPAQVGIAAPAPATLVQPAPPLQSRVCAGPALRVGTSDGQDALALGALAEPDVAVGTLGGDIAQSRLVVATVEGVSGGDAVVQRGEASTLSAAQALDVDAASVGGFAASECAESRLDQWLVGGSTRTGRQSVLTIANASEVGASVDVTLYGPDGPIQSVGSTGLAVAPGTETVLDLAAIAPGVPDTVVRVASTGAPVAAHLQQTTTRGLERGGFDIVDPVVVGTAAVLPGVRIGEASGFETQSDFDDTVPVLRVLSPTGGALRLAFQSGDGSVIESEGRLEAGRVTDFPLDELPVGTVTIRVESDAPVVAGARTVAISGEALDFDWVAGGQPRSGVSAIAVPEGPGATLRIVSASDAEQRIAIDGEPVTIPANGVHEQPVDAGSVEVEGEQLVIGVDYRSASEAGGFTASPQGPAAEGVLVLH